MADEDVYTGVHEVALDGPVHTDTAVGLVVKWRHRGGVWEGLVTHEVGGKITTEWLPAVVLKPSGEA